MDAAELPMSPNSFNYDDDDPILNVLLAQAYEESSQTIGYREDQEYQRAIELSLKASSTDLAQTTSTAAPSTWQEAEVGQSSSRPNLDPTLFDHLLAEQEQVRAGFDQAHLPQRPSERVERLDSPPKPPEVIVLSDGIFSSTVAPGQYFDAVWDVRVKETSKKGRAEWSNHGISLQPWGERRFAPDDCCLSCIHQEKIELDELVRIDEDGEEISKSPSLASSRRAAVESESGSHSAPAFKGKKRKWRTIRLKRLHLKAPSEEGQYEEVWRLRMRLGNDLKRDDGANTQFPFGSPFGDLFVIRIKVDAAASKNFPPKNFEKPMRCTLPTDLRYTLLGQGLRTSSAEAHLDLPVVEADCTYDFVFTLRNDGNSEWPTGLQISRVQATGRESGSSGKGKGKEVVEQVHLVVTDERRRFLCKPLSVGATARVILSGLKAPKFETLQEEKWRLWTKVRGVAIDIGEPLISRVRVRRRSRSRSPPPSFEQAVGSEEADWTMIENGAPSDTSTDGFSLISSSSRRSSFEKVERADEV